MEVASEELVEEEESSSSSSESEDEPPNVGVQLEQFRQQWQQELQLKTTPSGGENGNQSDASQPTLGIEEQAKLFFLQGVQAEQNGFLDNAIHFYRRAIQLVPDIEFKIEELRRKKKRRSRQVSECSVDSSGLPEQEEIENLLQHFSRLKASDSAICTPEREQRMTHISKLPVELIMIIFKWVVSSQVDMRALEQLGMVCRGFYLCARDEEMWRLACHKVWGINCGRPKAHGGIWRNMYIERPHLHFNGCYISKTTYFRQGQQGLDSFYRPFFQVDYFRFMRFFPNGVMYMVTSADDPYAIIPKLKDTRPNIQGLLQGHYRIAGNKVLAILKRKEQPDNSSKYRYKRRQQENQNRPEQTFHLELNMNNVGRKRFSQLEWEHFSVQTQYRGSSSKSSSEFHLSEESYPPLRFSRVKSYSATTDSPLK